MAAIAFFWCVYQIGHWNVPAYYTTGLAVHLHGILVLPGVTAENFQKDFMVLDQPVATHMLTLLWKILRTLGLLVSIDRCSIGFAKVVYSVALYMGIQLQSPLLVEYRIEYWNRPDGYTIGAIRL